MALLEALNMSQRAGPLLPSRARRKSSGGS
jgi:hypothetical protein